MAVDAQGNIYLAVAYSTNVILKISTSGMVSTVAGNGTAGFSGDGALAINAELNHPTSVAVDGSGNLFISDLWNYRIREVTSAGIISTIGGNGTFGESGDGGPALNAAITPGPLGIDGAGNVFVRDGSSVREISANGIIATVATIVANGGLAVDGKGNVYISLPSGNVIDEIAVGGAITPVAGNGTAFSGIGGPATSA
jgi:hypothetical protein